jgi:DNA-directed RNA polymerase beta subunit
LKRIWDGPAVANLGPHHRDQAVEPIAGRMDVATCSNQSLERVRSTCETLWAVSDVRTLSNEDLAHSGSSLRRGVPVATPVFDGAKASPTSRCSMLEEAGFDVLQASHALRRRTGEPFDRKVTVGIDLHAEAAPPGR